MKKVFQTRLNRITSFLLAILMFMVLAPINPFLAAFMATGMVAMSFMPSHYFRGILGENPPPGNTDEAALLEKIKGKMDLRWKELVDNATEFKTVKTLKDKMDALKVLNPDELKDHEVIKKLIKEMDEALLEIKALKEPKKSMQHKSFADAIYESLKLHSKREKIAGTNEMKNSALMDIQEGKIKGISLTVKAAGTLTTSNVTPVGSGISLLLTDQERGIERTPRSQPFFIDLLNVGNTNKTEYAYAEMKNNDGGAGMTAQGSAKTQADFDIMEARAAVKKVTSYIKVSKEALDDIEGLANEINTELKTLVKLKVDNQLLTGDGTGNNLTGVITAATAYDAGSFAATIPAANNFDVLATAVNQIMIAEVISGEPAGFMPTAIVVNPIDFMAMKLTKDLNDTYLFPVLLPGMDAVINVPVVSNARMTAGKFLVGDFSKAYVKIREDVTITIGVENDDFTKNLVTILAEARLAAFVKSNHAKAFVYGDFATAKTALDLPVIP